VTDAPTDDQLAIGRAFEEVVAWLRRSRSTADISATGLSVLDRLDVNGPQRVTDLAALEGISQPATTSLVNRLEGRGWARRDADPTDGRAARVALTEVGRERLQQHRSDRSRRIAQRLSTLDAADQAALIAALPALVHLTSARPAPRPSTPDLAHA
jgi:DNA-binding MarR family transcriptional regulator